MNTMYRNNKVTNEYDQVKTAFESKTSEINSKVNVQNQPNIMDKLCKDEIVNIKEKLDKAVEGMTELKWPDEKNSFDTKPFDAMPKALLHVHSKVGLSVDQLFELFGEINKEASNDDEKIGFVVETENETVKQVMYKKQFKSVYGESPENITFEEYAEGSEEYKKYFRFENKPDKAWIEFNNIFLRMEPPFHIEEFYGKYHKKLFDECVKNNIKYVELRVGFDELTSLEKWRPQMLTSLREGFQVEDYFYHKDMMLSVTPNDPKAKFLQIILEESKKSRLQGNVKVILTANRNTPDKGDVNETKKKICEKLDTTIAIKNGMAQVGVAEKDKEIAEMVIGFDLVNQEFDNKGLTDEYASILYDNFGKEFDGTGFHKYWLSNPTKIDLLQNKKRIQLIRLFLHDGESVDVIRNKNDNAITGPICSRHRIGHGFKMGAKDNFNVNETSDDRKYGNLISDYILYGFPEDVDNSINNYPIELNDSKYLRMDAVLEPVIELCPISNYMLNYVNDFKEHPAINLMKKGILAVICNDDPQIFDNPGLSYDYAVMYAALVQKIGKTTHEPYDFLKLSAFLGFFYQEMSKYYYCEEKIGTESICMVNDDMEAGDSGSPLDGSEHKIFKNAVEHFNSAWVEYEEGLKSIQ